MNVFVAVAEEEGFAAGARRLRMSPPAVTRAVAALESRLGIKLLNRTTRYVRATDAGQRYLEDARRILADADAADEAAAGVNADPRGRLAVTAPVLFGRMFVMPGILEYLRRYPERTSPPCSWIGSSTCSRKGSTSACASASCRTPACMPAWRDPCVSSSAHHGNICSVTARRRFRRTCSGIRSSRRAPAATPSIGGLAAGRLRMPASIDRHDQRRRNRGRAWRVRHHAAVVLPGRAAARRR